MQLMSVPVTLALVSLGCSSTGGAAKSPAPQESKAPVSSATPDAASEHLVVVHAGELLAVPGEESTKEQSIIVRDGRIAEISDGFIRPPGARVIDWSDYFVVPGLIDSHVHLLHELNPNSRLDTVTQSDARLALLGAERARRTLEAGFTTVRDVGASSNAIFDLRDAIAMGLVSGPRIFASGGIITPTGGHADVHGYRDDVLAALAPNAVCDGPADCRRAVRLQVKHGADHIKITATGGVLSNTSAGTEQQFFRDELEAMVQTAHQLGRKVTAHAHGKVGLEEALRAGVDSIEHGTYLDAQTIALFKKTGAYLVPTVLAGETVAEWSKLPNVLPPASRAKAAEVGPRMLEMLRLAHQGDVKIAFGTDSGVSRHGDNAREFELMVRAGMTGEEALKAATVEAANHLGQGNQLGALKSGFFADMIAVNSDPRASVAVLNAVQAVIREGELVATRREK